MSLITDAHLLINGHQSLRIQPEVKRSNLFEESKLNTHK